MTWYEAALLLTGAVALLCGLWIFLLSYFGMRSVCVFKGRSRDACVRYDIAHGFYTAEEYETMKKTGDSFSVASPHGYELKAMRLLAGKMPGDRVVIIVHGYGCHMFTSVRYVRVFRALGYDCVIYDHRYHGESGGDCCTLGGRETDDLLAVAKTVSRMYPADSVIGLHGESMGAATALLALSHDFPFSFCIADCGFASAAEQLSWLVRRYTFFFRKPVYTLLLRFLHRKTGVDFEKVLPIQAVASKQAAGVPVLFIHGEADRFVPFDNVQKLYHAKKGVKALYTVPGARHAESIRMNREAYKAQVAVFLQSCFFK